MRGVPVAALARATFSPEQATRFVSAELPARARWLLQRLQQDGARLAALPPYGALLDTLSRAAGRPEEPTGGAAAAARSLRDEHEQLEAGLRALVPALRDVARAADDLAVRGAVQRVATRAHRHVISQRVLLAHLAASCEPEAPAEPTCIGACDLSALCASTAEEALLFCREKHGDAPELRVALPKTLLACTVPSYVHFSLMEVLKNALGSHVRRYGVLALCDAPPVELALAPSAGGAAVLRVRDRGGGMGVDERRLACAFFHTTNPEREPNYTYSRAFGSQFHGLGVGLPLAAAHLRYLGGDLVLSSFGGGCTAYLALDRTGGPRTDPMPAQDDELG